MNFQTPASDLFPKTDIFLNLVTGDTPDSPKVKENAEAPTNPDDGDDNVTPQLPRRRRNYPPRPLIRDLNTENNVA